MFISINKAILTSLVLAVFSFGQAQALPLYTLTDLGTLGGDTVRSWSINDMGQIVGTSDTSDGWQRAFLWDPVVGMSDLGSLRGPASRGRGINNKGQVTGMTPTNKGNSAFLWAPSTGMVALGDMLPDNNHDMSDGYGINDKGQVVGWSETADALTSPRQAFLWDPANGMTILGSLIGARGGDSSAIAINDNSQVAGTSVAGAPMSPGRHAFFWDSSTGMIDLGTLGGTTSDSSDINNRGQIVGFSPISTGSPRHAFLWDPSTGMIDLGTLGGEESWAHGINDQGQVVGASRVNVGNNFTGAFLWDPVLGMLDLNDLVVDLSGWSHITVATDISNTGYITGFGFTESGMIRSFLLTPVSASVPEPESFLLFVLGLAGLWFARRQEFRGQCTNNPSRSRIYPRS